MYYDRAKPVNAYSRPIPPAEASPSGANATQGCAGAVLSHPQPRKGKEKKGREKLPIFSLVSFLPEWHP
jgi:hypothetical protein